MFKNAFKDKKLAPLIDFNAIVDTDLGLIQLIYDQYLDQNVFDISKFNRPLNEVIKDLYYRKDINPLYTFAKENISHDTLDEYYNEFINTKYKDILDRSSGTNLSIAINLFNNSTEIKTSILCHNKEQEEFIRNIDQFKNDSIFYTKDIQKNKLRFEQYFFKYIEDCLSVLDFSSYSKIYISTHHLNLNDNNDDIKKCDVRKEISRRDRLCLYDMYNIDFLEGE